MSQFRTRFKTIAASKVSGYYNLTSDNVGAERLEKLLESAHFIYPGNVLVSLKLCSIL